MMLTKNFSYDELKCPCCDRLEMDQDFLTALQEIRDTVGRPFDINSAYRCESHNLLVGGAQTSKHRLGMAVDISTIRWSPDDLHYLLFEMTSYHSDSHDYNTGVGIYKNHIHFDLRVDQESLWVNL